MFSSKFYYIVTGFDIAFSLLGAVTHQASCFLFLICAILLNFIGDDRKRLEEELKKGEQK